MKPTNSTYSDLSGQLRELPQLQMPEDIFGNVKKQIQSNSFIKRHRYATFMSVVAVMAVSMILIIQNNTLDEKDLLIQELVTRTMQLEQLLASESPVYSPPGTDVLEKIVNIENYLAKLDEDIQKTNDKNIKSQLMASKLDLLGDLVLLQRKMNKKPDYQKVKPYVI